MTLKLQLPFGSTAKQQPEPPQEPSYHAVSVKAGRNPCSAVQSFAGKRVLSAEALLLPLADCDRATHCTCSYRHHADRRAGPRRHAEGAPPTGGVTEYSEQREGRGRRSEDRHDYDEFNSDTAEESRLVADTYYGYVRKPATD